MRSLIFSSFNKSCDGVDVSHSEDSRNLLLSWPEFAAVKMSFYQTTQADLDLV